VQGARSWLLEEHRRSKRLSIWAVACIAILGAALTGGFMSPPGAHAADPPTALINGDTVIPSSDQPPKSDEQIQAEANGFTVTVVDGTTWDAMTEAQFRAYDVLIVGDPFCSSIAPSVTANLATWTKAVMDSGGNRFTVGSDPVWHSGLDSTNARNHIIKDGIAFAGAQTGATGAYVDTSCEASSNNTDILNALSLSGTGWTVETPACAGNIGIVASVPGFVTTDADLSNWFCSSHADYPSWASDWVPFAISADAPTQNYCATDIETKTQVCGEPYILLAGPGVTIISDISLSPASATNPVGTSHTVTATVLKDGSPLSGKTVTFTISAGPNAGASGTCAPLTCVTDSNGHVTFTYADTGGAGTDTIVAQFTDDSGRVQQATASKTWSTETEVHTTLTKTADPTSGVAPLTVTYTYHEANDGTEPLTGVAVTDDMCSPVTRGPDSPGDNDATLESGETWTFTCTHTFTTAGTFTNTATATGTTSTGAPAPEERATATVTVTEVHTTLTKTASPASGPAPLTVTYTYQETNDGTEPLTGVTLTDDTCSPVARGPDSPGNVDSTLEPGETWTFTCTHTFTAAETFTNSVTATGTMSTGAPAPEEHASATVTVTAAAVQVRSPGYWKNHQAATTALLPQTLGSFTVSDSATAKAIFDAMNCSNSSTSTQNAVGCLAGQLLAAKLNVAIGASACIAPTIAAADAFLISIGYTGPTGTYTLTADQRATAISLKSTLDAYNNTGTCL